MAILSPICVDSVTGQQTVATSSDSLTQTSPALTQVLSSGNTAGSNGGIVFDGSTDADRTVTGTSIRLAPSVLGDSGFVNLIAAAGTATTNGSNVTINAGLGGSNNSTGRIGGSVYLNGGSCDLFGVTPHIGGARIQVSGGSGNLAGGLDRGGDLDMRGGHSTGTASRDGGNVNISGGDTDDDTGGSVTILGGIAEDAAGTHGSVTIDSGTGTGTTFGTVSLGATSAASIAIGHTTIDTTIRGGLIGGAATGTTDDGDLRFGTATQSMFWDASATTLNLTPASGANSTILVMGDTANRGAVTMTAEGNGGAGLHGFIIQGSAGVGGANEGTDIEIYGGAASGTGTGGDLDFFAGAGGTSGEGGAVRLRSGIGGSASPSGTLEIATGAASAGASGNITIDVGTASTTAGTITIGGTSASALAIGRSGITTDFLSGSTVDFTGATVTGLTATFLNVGSATAATSTGDIAGGDGTRQLTYDAGTNRMWLSENTNPAGTLPDQSGTNWLMVASGSTNANIRERTAHATLSSTFGMERSKGTLTSPTALSDTDIIGDWIGKAYIGGTSEYQTVARIRMRVDGTVTDTSSSPGSIQFLTVPDSSITQTLRWTIRNDGVFEGDVEAGAATIRGANATTAATAGAGISILGGDGLTSGVGGSIVINGGASPSGTDGVIFIGVANTSLIDIGSSGIKTNFFSGSTADFTGVSVEGLPSVISTTASVDLTTIGDTTLYTVPAGLTCKIISVVITPTSVTAAGADSTVSVGTNSTPFDNIIADTTLTGLDAITESFTMEVGGVSHIGAAAEAITFRVDTADTGTTMTATVELIGYLV